MTSARLGTLTCEDEPSPQHGPLHREFPERDQQPLRGQLTDVTRPGGHTMRNTGCVAPAVPSSAVTSTRASLRSACPAAPLSAFFLRLALRLRSVVDQF